MFFSPVPDTLICFRGFISSLVISLMCHFSGHPHPRDWKADGGSKVLPTVHHQPIASGIREHRVQRRHQRWAGGVAGRPPPAPVRPGCVLWPCRPMTPEWRKKEHHVSFVPVVPLLIYNQASGCTAASSWWRSSLCRHGNHHSSSPSRPTAFTTIWVSGVSGIKL